MVKYQHIRVSTCDQIGIIELNRPESLNALNRRLIAETAEQLEKFDKDSDIRVIIIKGNEQVFAAGADIEEMINESTITFEMADPFSDWERFLNIKKPIIASTNGFVLGGGFELALHCDFIVSAENTKFGFPEVNLGVLPGAGGTQLLTRAIGRARAMEWIMDGEQRSAEEVYALGIVNKLVPNELLHEQTIKFARTFEKKAPISLRLIKEAVRKAEDVSLREGLLIERKNFYIAFDSQDQKEGMHAFVERRKPLFKGE